MEKRITELQKGDHFEIHDTLIYATSVQGIEIYGALDRDGDSDIEFMKKMESGRCNSLTFNGAIAKVIKLNPASVGIQVQVYDKSKNDFSFQKFRIPFTHNANIMFNVIGAYKIYEMENITQTSERNS